MTPKSPSKVVNCPRPLLRGFSPTLKIPGFTPGWWRMYWRSPIFSIWKVYIIIFVYYSETTWFLNQGGPQPNIGSSHIPSPVKSLRIWAELLHWPTGLKSRNSNTYAPTRPLPKQHFSISLPLSVTCFYVRAKYSLEQRFGITLHSSPLRASCGVMPHIGPTIPQRSPGYTSSGYLTASASGAYEPGQDIATTAQRANANLEQVSSREQLVFWLICSGGKFWADILFLEYERFFQLSATEIPNARLESVRDRLR